MASRPGPNRPRGQLEHLFSKSIPVQLGAPGLSSHDAVVTTRMLAQHLSRHLAESAFDKVSTNRTPDRFAHDKTKAGVGLYPIPLQIDD